MVIALAADQLRQLDVRCGYVLDGSPRTAHQAETLDEILDSTDAHLDCCNLLSVDPDTIVERISKRAASEGRLDDTPTCSVENREC